MNRYVFLYRGKRKTVLFKEQNAASGHEERKFKTSLRNSLPELKNLDGELRKMKIENLRKILHAQPNVMTSFSSTNDDVLTVSCIVSKLIAKKLKPYDNGAWANELLAKEAKKLAPKSVHLYQKLRLFPPFACEGIKEIDQDIENNLKKS